MNMPKFIIMCGLVASGKSYRAQELAKEYDATIFSSDSLREELYGDINDQEHNQEVFVELHKRIKECLRSGKSAIMDATNLNYKKRMSFLNELKNISCEKICVLMATPYEKCIEHNANRERKVPEYVLERMFRSFDPPYYYEGWNQIYVEYPESFESNEFFEWLNSVQNFNQDNPHHTLTLGEHCEAVLDYLWETYGGSDEHSIILRRAGALHDIGKCFTKTFKNSKGEVTDVAHYYSHEYCGSYASLFYGPPNQALYMSVLIRWHMQPYYYEKDNNEKLHNKYRKLWGEELYQDIMALHAADKAAH